MTDSDAARQLVLDFMESWETHKGLLAGYDRYIADDCEWRNTGMRDVDGKEEVLALVARTAETWGEYYMATRKRAIATEGRTVIVERVDVMFTAASEVFLEVPIVGVFEVRGDKIASWRDYYDPKPMFDSAKKFAAARAGAR